MTNSILFGAMLLVFGMSAHADEAPAWLPPLLHHYRIPASGFSLYVRAVDASDARWAFAADTPRSPASTMKLLTTLAALEELGPAYVWKTEAYTTGVLHKGRLAGDVYLKGYGDPYLITESFWTLPNGVRQAGVDEIGGDLVLDESYLQPDNIGSADFDGQQLRAYNAMPSALLLNFQTINLRFIPNARARRLVVIADPHPDNVVIDNQVRLTSGLCRNWAQRLNLQVLHRGAQHTIRLTGKYSTACGEHELYRVLSDTPDYIYGVFKSLWRQLGGRFNGALREATVPPDAERLFSVDSRPLADILRSINKYSNNVMTRELVLTMGAERYGAPGTSTKGLQVVRDWLARNGLVFPELVLENGVGLSRVEQITARHLGALLLRGYNGRFMPEFMSSLPVAGFDGTLQRRFINTPIAGQLHAKTGSLNDVRSLAGYLMDAHGRRWVVVMFHNDATAESHAAAQLQEAILRRLYNGE